jgi:hypothetical protein
MEARSLVKSEPSGTTKVWSSRSTAARGIAWKRIGAVKVIPADETFVRPLAGKDHSTAGRQAMGIDLQVQPRNLGPR